MRSYQETNLVWLLDWVDIQDAHILEIGGDRDSTVAKALRKLGAERVTSINRDRGFQSPQQEHGVERLEMDAREITLPANSIDVVFGVAVLEHLLDPQVVLDNLYEVVRPGGYIYLQGAPLWNCFCGHHIYVSAPSGKTFRFDEHNPIPDWGHLSMDRDELYKQLVKDGCEEADAGTIVQWVFDNERINRYSATYLRSVFSDCQFNLIECEIDQAKKPTPMLAQQLFSRWQFPVDEFSVYGIRFLLQKPG